MEREGYGNRSEVERKQQVRRERGSKRERERCKSHGNSNQKTSLK